MNTLKLFTRVNFSRHIRRNYHGVQVPFQDDLSELDDDLFNLGDFKHYQESPDVIRKRQELLNESTKSVAETTSSIISKAKLVNDNDLIENCLSESPLAIVSKLSNPYLNLAIEDYVFTKMPILKDTEKNCNRLMFYTNSPCVVIGKNQNPWSEVNLPLLNSLNIPLVRRRSGGGTVVHDLGNVNYSFMTTRAKFDRFKFANIVTLAINKYSDSKYKLEVNERGDITTEMQPDGVNYKVSGSAYKIAKGKSYHHGTMLLNLRLDILGKLLSRTDNLGTIDSSNSIQSVKSKVTNLEIDNEKFIELVLQEFKETYGTEVSDTRDSQLDCEAEEFDQNELFGLTNFIEANQLKDAKVVYVDETTELPESITKTATELQEWAWKFGSTPKFSHRFTNKKLGFDIKFMISKGAIVDKFELTFSDFPHRPISEEKIQQSFEFLQTAIEEGNFKYSGSNIAGFITNDIISDWIGLSIDGTM